ncbi:Dynamin-3 [Manis javanica]|nr:Dynamin-3 [Manis javanica]
MHEAISSLKSLLAWRPNHKQKTAPVASPTCPSGPALNVKTSPPRGGQAPPAALRRPGALVDFHCYPKDGWSLNPAVWTRPERLHFQYSNFKKGLESFPSDKLKLRTLSLGFLLYPVDRTPWVQPAETQHHKY